MKMDSRGPLILICCMVSIFAIVGLFIVSFRMNRLNCELVIIEPEKLRTEAIEDWNDSKPFRSQDKSILIKLAAHLEYFNPDILKASESGENSSNYNQQNQPQQQQIQQQIPGLPVPVLSEPNTNNTNGRHPIPSMPQSGFTNQQLHNSSAFSNSSSNFNSKKENNKRFQQLVLQDVNMDKSDDEYKYTLKFTCATIAIDFIRRPERVYVKQVHIHLKPASFQHEKTSCDLNLPAQGAFSVDVNANDHLAHYYCDKPLRYSCYYYPSKSSNQPSLHLADLLIHKLEFELPGKDSIDSVHKNHNFLSKRRECVV